ncbi:MAG: nitrogen fixation protein NifH [Methanomassiliicoccales archaeon]|jgi:hypothetical protein
MSLGEGRSYQEIVDWLSSSDDPTVRLATLTEIEGFSESEPEVATARLEAMQTGPIPIILSKQCPGGFWGKEEDFYMRSKYKGTVWNVILLAQLGVDGNDPRVRSAAEFLLRWSQHHSGGFAYTGSGDGGCETHIVPCLHGNLVWSMLRYRMGNDARVRAGVDWIARYQRFDDNEGPAPKGWPYGMNNCWGRHTCHMGAIKSLKAISAIPSEDRSEALSQVASMGAEHLLKHHLYKRSHKLSKVAKPEWTRLGFPHFWDTDVLEMLEVLADLGYRDDRMEDAVDLIKSKRGPDGKWRNERSYYGRMLVSMERPDDPSHWVTLKALAVLKKLNRLD